MYAIVSLESGNALRWFSSEGEALEAVRSMVQVEPDAVASVGLRNVTKVYGGGRESVVAVEYLTLTVGDG